LQDLVWQESLAQETLGRTQLYKELGSSVSVGTTTSDSEGA